MDSLRFTIILKVAACFIVLRGNNVEASAQNYDPCCSSPCKNFGICNRVAFTERYTCDCYGTEYYGKNCEIPTFRKWVIQLLRPSPFTVQYLMTHGENIWKMINNIKFLHDYIMHLIVNLRAFLPTWPERHNTLADYATWDGYSNKSYYSLTLQAVPENCPTPMGVAGPKVLPDAGELIEKVFTRTEFKPCPRGTSVLLPLYGQHFTHQGFKTNKHDARTTWGNHVVDGSHIYGETLAKQLALRTRTGGKMKMQVKNGELFPPNIKDTPGVDIDLPIPVPLEDRYGLGHPFFALLPTLVYWTTLWLREHNWICDVLAKEHPDWDDERLYQTARLIVLGETLTVTMSEYIQLAAGIKFQFTYDPSLIHDSPMRWGSSRIHVEFNTLYHWHSMIPSYLTIGGRNYSLEDISYNIRPLTDHGMAEFTTSLSNQVAGRGAGGRNMDKTLLHVAKKTLLWNRQLRLRPFNDYRQFFRLPRLKSFEELTGEKKLAKVLSDFYGGDIDGVEYFVGMLVERRHSHKMWGLSLIEAIASYAIRSIYSNILGSPEYWRESTFGGKTGFQLVKNATFQSIVCRNVRGCPKIRFQVTDI